MLFIALRLLVLGVLLYYFVYCFLYAVFTCAVFTSVLLRVECTTFCALRLLVLCLLLYYVGCVKCLLVRCVYFLWSVVYNFCITSFSIFVRCVCLCFVYFCVAALSALRFVRCVSLCCVYFCITLTAFSAF